MIKIGGPEYRSMEHAVAVVNKAFNTTCYLVGSATGFYKSKTKRQGFRDVDIRVILDDDRFEEIFDGAQGEGSSITGGRHAMVSLLNVAISEYLQKRTDLPVDFQIQRRGDVSQKDWDKVREPLGMFL